MALIQVNYVSAALQRTVPVQVILPVDKLTPDGKLPARKKFKTLYLLHGFLGNYTDWVSGTRIQRWAEERDLCVVMPSGDNAFYVDRPETGNCYGQFIGEELVEMTRRMFPLSRKREDTFIGGLSMGGFGAMMNGLKYHKTFGAVISFPVCWNCLRSGKKHRMARIAPSRRVCSDPMQQRSIPIKTPSGLQRSWQAKRIFPKFTLPAVQRIFCSPTAGISGIFW